MVLGLGAGLLHLQWIWALVNILTAFVPEEFIVLKPVGKS